MASKNLVKKITVLNSWVNEISICIHGIFLSLNKSQGVGQCRGRNRVNPLTRGFWLRISAQYQRTKREVNQSLVFTQQCKQDNIFVCQI